MRPSFIKRWLPDGCGVGSLLALCLPFCLAFLGFERGAHGAVVGETTPQSYQWSVLAAGIRPYIDREYTLGGVPDELAGIPFLRTANDDKRSDAEVLVRFTLDAPGTVLVFYDGRQGDTAWLSDWTKRDGVTLVSHETSQDVTYTLFEKDFPAGEVVIPGPAYPPGSSISTNYWVALGEAPAPCGNCMPSGASKLKLTWDPNPEKDNVIDYPVYRGPDENADQLLANVAGTEYESDASELGLTWGERICFRLKAHNRCTMDGKVPEGTDCYSEFSDAACATMNAKPEDIPLPSAPTRLHLDVTLSVGGN